MDDIRKVKQILKNIGAATKDLMVEITVDLAKMVAHEEIYGVVFSKNIETDGAIFINIETPKSGDEFALGAYSDLTLFAGFNTLSPEIQQKMEDFNEFLEFANSYLRDDLPAIKEKYYFSKKAVQGYTDKNTLLPPYIDDITFKECVAEVKEYATWKIYITKQR